VQNFILFSKHINQADSISYCEEITSKQSAYLLKYMPYQCSLCRKFSSEILIVQCSTKNPELYSCNSSICMQCSLEFFHFMVGSEGSTQQPIEECGFCSHSLILKELPGDPLVNQTNLQLLPQSSHFSNIEELDAEHDPESDSNDAPNRAGEFSNRNSMTNRALSPSKAVQSSRSKKKRDGDSMLFEEAVAQEDEESLSQIPNEIPNKKFELDNLIIRDATKEEKEELTELALQVVNNTISMTATQAQSNQVGRCSLIQMTPRNESSGNVTDRDNEGFDSARSQLTGLKPKALEFESPVKSPVKQQKKKY